jgi:hypothetical protein
VGWLVADKLVADLGPDAVSANQHVPNNPESKYETKKGLIGKCRSAIASSHMLQLSRCWWACC